jgi:hypothetical protein
LNVIANLTFLDVYITSFKLLICSVFKNLSSGYEGSYYGVSIFLRHGQAVPKTHCQLVRIVDDEEAKTSKVGPTRNTSSFSHYAMKESSFPYYRSNLQLILFPSDAIHVQIYNVEAVAFGEESNSYLTHSVILCMSTMGAGRYLNGNFGGLYVR